MKLGDVAQPMITLLEDARAGGVGNATTQIVKITVTNGPRVTIIKPAIPDSMTAGNTLRIIVNATSTVGVTVVGFDLTDSGWLPTWSSELP